MAEIKLSREQRRGAIAAIQRYFEEERGESVGELAAMLFLDFLVEEIGEIFYNKGVDDAQVLLRRQWSALDDEPRGDQDACAPALDRERRRRRGRRGRGLADPLARHIAGTTGAAPAGTDPRPGLYTDDRPGHRVDLEGE